jgi:hypothetical protein
LGEKRVVNLDGLGILPGLLGEDLDARADLSNDGRPQGPLLNYAARGREAWVGWDCVHETLLLFRY